MSQFLTKNRISTVHGTNHLYQGIKSDQWIPRYGPGQVDWRTDDAKTTSLHFFEGLKKIK